MVVKPLRSTSVPGTSRSYSSYSSTGSSSSSQSWSKAYGRSPEVRKFRTKHTVGHISTTDLSSTRLESKYSGGTPYVTVRFPVSRKGKVTTYEGPPSRPTRISRSVDRDVEADLLRSRKLLESGHTRKTYYSPRHPDDDEIAAVYPYMMPGMVKKVRGYGVSKEFAKTLMVNQDDLDFDLSQKPKKSTKTKVHVRSMSVDREYLRGGAYGADFEDRQTLRKASREKASEYQGLDFRTMYDGVPRISRYKVDDADDFRMERLKRYASDIANMHEDMMEKRMSHYKPAEVQSESMRRHVKDIARMEEELAELRTRHPKPEEEKEDWQVSLDYRRKRRAPMYRLEGEEGDEEEGGGRAVEVKLPRVTTASVGSYVGMEDDEYLRSRGPRELETYVIHPEKKLSPDNVKVVTLPSGRRAVTYVQAKQYGMAANPHEANNALDRVVERTRHMQHQVSSLEEFIRRNRRYFPEDLRIYQSLRFFQLNEDQLKDIGENPDAEVYGVKVIEKLVVPPGTDLSILSRHLGKHYDVEVSQDEYRKQLQRKVEEDQEIEYSKLQEAIRARVEMEFEAREKKRVVGEECYEVREASKHLIHRDKYDHMHSHVTPEYIKSIYSTAGYEYSDIYSGPRSRRSSVSDLTSEPDSVRSGVSTASRRKKRFDTTPTFTHKLRPKRCIVGQTVRFNCSVSGLPPPDITWFHGNRTITPGPRVTIGNNYGLLCLEICNSTKEDSGLYTVRAQNIEGEVACSASLDVQEVLADEPKSGTSKPYFVVEPNNMWVEVGSRAVFEVQAKGQPLPSFRWQRDNIPISPDDRIKMFEDNFGNAKLVMRSIQPTDAGLYFCIADNKVGKAKCAASLRVAERGQLPEDERRRSRSRSREPTPVRRVYSRETTPVLDLGPPPEKGVAPWFVNTPPETVTVMEGDVLTVKCVVDGDPKPVVTWLKGAREIQYTKRIRVVVGGDHHMMEFKSALETDPGQYTILVENSLGRVHFNFWVNVRKRIELDVEDWEVKRSLLQLPEFEYEAIARGELGNQRPMFVKRLPIEMEVEGGANLELKGRTKEGSPVKRERVEWKKKLVKEGEIVTVSESGKREVFKEAAPAAPAIKGTVPKVIMHLYDQTVKKGSLCALSMRPNKADPAPTVEWYREGQLLKAGEHFRMFFETGCHKLEVSGFTAEMEGEFSCTLTNELGSATSKCRLTLAEEPVMIERFMHDKWVKEGAPVSLEVAVNKEGQVAEWSKDDQLLVPSDRLQMVTDGAEHRLLIHSFTPEDAGQYAVTVGGRQSHAKLSLREPTPPPAEPQVKEEEDQYLLPRPKARRVRPKRESASSESEPEIPRPKIAPVTRKSESESKSESGSESSSSSPSSSSSSKSSKSRSVSPAPVAPAGAHAGVPTFTNKLKNVSVEEMDPAVLDCKVLSDPEASIEWKKDGETIIPSARFELRHIGGVCTFKIKRTRISDTGVYSIHATNEGGTISCSAKLKVKGMDESSESGSDHGSSSSASSSGSDTETGGKKAKGGGSGSDTEKGSGSGSGSESDSPRDQDTKPGTEGGDDSSAPQDDSQTGPSLPQEGSQKGHSQGEENGQKDVPETNDGDDSSDKDKESLLWKLEEGILQLGKQMLVQYNTIVDPFMDLYWAGDSTQLN